MLVSFSSITDVSFKRIWPSVGVRGLSGNSMRVVFPDPLGPTMAVLDPGGK